MGLWERQVVPRAINLTCGIKSSGPMRQRVCEGLSGEVVEIGAGSALNAPFYPAAVTRVDAVEPSDVAWRLGASRLAAAPMPVERTGLDAQALPYVDDRFDAALSTWTLCTIPDVDAALAELRRILKPHGALHFVEHGLAPDERVRVWQRRLEPFQKRFVGGCHLTRPIATLLRRAGFVLTQIDEFYQPGAPRTGAAYTVGIAVSP
jgi:ubiquinone/menaquinone biosynthesis C-methylase UbiE